MEKHYECIGNYEVYSQKDGWYTVRLSNGARESLKRLLVIPERDLYSALAIATPGFSYDRLNIQRDIAFLWNARRLARKRDRQLSKFVHDQLAKQNHAVWLDKKRQENDCGSLDSE